MRRIGRYELFDEFASGGMAAIHFGRLSSDSGFSRVVAIKRLHPQLAKDPEFVGMFVEEARVAGRIQHPNVVAVRDVVRDGDELLLVMDYVHGEPLSSLVRAANALEEPVPPDVAAAIVAMALHGLHAAHEARGDGGARLDIVHRDVSPQNVLVGADGVARVADFGVAKALGRAQHTAEGSLKGKVAYFAPEQLKNDVDRRTDVFAAGVVLWEALLGERLFAADTHWEIVENVLHAELRRPSDVDPAVPAALSDVVMRALSRDRDARFPTARAMAVALEKVGVATTAAVGEWVERLAGERLKARLEQKAAVEGAPASAPSADERTTTRAHRPDRGPPPATVTATPGAGADVRPTRSGASNALVVGAIGIGVVGIAFGVGVLLKARDPAPAASGTEASPAVSDVPRVVPAVVTAPSVTPSVPSPVIVAPSPSAAPSASAPPSAKAATAPQLPPDYCDDKVICPTGKGCQFNRCLSCPPLTAGCNGRCVNVTMDPNCGGCGIDCAIFRGRCVNMHCEPWPSP